MNEFIFNISLGILAVLGTIVFEPPSTGLTNRTVKSKGYICWATPTKKALKKCQKENSCTGVGTYAWHRKREFAKKLAVKQCNQRFGTCYFDYCERAK